MKRAGLSLIKEYQLLPKETIQKIESYRSKHEQDVIIGRMERTNKELVKATYATLKDLRGSIKKGAEWVAKSDVGEFAIQYKKSLFEDIKSGTTDTTEEE